MRPVLTPAAPLLWRDAATLQVGRGGGRSAVIGGIDGRLRECLQLLDGAHDRERVLRVAAARGCPAERVEALLDLLEQTGLLDDAGQDTGPLTGLTEPERGRMAADLRALALVRGDGGLPALELRRSAAVLVVGAGRVGVPLATALATAGIGAVDIVDDYVARPEDAGVGGLALDDVGRRRGEAARELLHRAAPSMPRVPMTRPDLVVLAQPHDESRQQARALLLDAVPHLLVEIRGTTGVVGPLVLPGRTPCARCLDLTRCDLDPAWPALAAQLATTGTRHEACDGPLALAVAAQAAMQVLAMVDGTTDPVTLGGTVEMSLPDWQWRRRTWPPHPDCGCTAAPG